ncbi:cytidine deaminase [Hyphococcus sp.]|uniref:cytidine deaminase n=1 Tax=Hyphococcus sp. TaxID=2038636 RepID=UPI003CCBC7AB
MTCTDEELFEHALKIRERAYAPYSKFKVGAAILDKNGAIHCGCNVENAAYPLGNCAETSAIAAMVSAGGGEIAKIAVLGGADAITECAPCGGCRQAIAEFAGEDTAVLLKGADGVIQSLTVAELLPRAFRLKS